MAPIPTTARSRGLWALAVLAVGLAGCAPELADRDDLRIAVRGNTVYVVAAEQAAVSSLCTVLGQATPPPAPTPVRAPAEPRDVSAIPRCVVRAAHVIVCADGDGACVAHEERHAREGNFHR